QRTRAVASTNESSTRMLCTTDSASGVSRRMEVEAFVERAEAGVAAEPGASPAPNRAPASSTIVAGAGLPAGGADGRSGSRNSRRSIGTTKCRNVKTITTARNPGTPFGQRSAAHARNVHPATPARARTHEMEFARPNTQTAPAKSAGQRRTATDHTHGCSGKLAT